MKYLSIFFCFFFFSCQNNNTSKNSLLAQIEKNKTADSIINLKNCIKNNDTIFKNGNYIKYIAFHNFYDVKISIGGIDTLLGFKFNCNTPRGLVPKYFSKTKNKFYLKCGSGQHFREIIICELGKNNIHVNRFESERSYEAEYDFAYKESKNIGKLILLNNFTDKKKVINIPAEVVNESIIKTEIHRSYVVLNFPRDKKVAIPF